jgi:hypothetical protein
MQQHRPIITRQSLNRWRAAPAVMAIVAVMALAWAGTPAGAGPVAHMGRTCSVPKYPGLGYFTSLTVTGTSCATGDKLAIAYYKCRTRSGPAGRCTSSVLGFSCHEQRNSIPTEIDARVTCQRHNEKVVHTYQQDT